MDQSHYFSKGQMMTTSNEISLHDGILRDIRISIEDSKVVVGLLCYKDSSSSIKERFDLNLCDVDSLSITINLNQMKFMAGHGGNVNDWNVDDEDSTSIDFTGGHAIFKSKNIEIVKL